MNLEILVEERSAVEFEVRVFQGKPDLMKKLPRRLKGYSTWITHADTCLVVLVDRDNDDCLILKTEMEKMTAAAGLPTITAASAGCRALERVLQASGYHRGGLAKIAAATEIAQHMNVDINRSRSFQVFRDEVRRLVAGGTSAAQD